MTLITRDDRPPPRKDVLWVDRPKAESKGRYIIYSQRFQGVWSHWTGNKTLPCYHDHEKCFKKHDGESRRWYGYLHCYSFQRQGQVFLQVPAGSALAFLEQVAPGASLRGMGISVERGKGKKSPLKIEVSEAVAARDPATLPPYRDCLKSVLHMWGIFEVDLSIDTRLIRDQTDIPDEEAA